MFEEMLGKLQQMQQQVAVLKTKLDSIMVKGEADNGAVVAFMNGNGKLLNLEVSEALTFTNDKDQIEDLIIIAINRAMDKANDVADSERATMSREMLPGFPGMV